MRLLFPQNLHHFTTPHGPGPSVLRRLKREATIEHRPDLKNTANPNKRKFAEPETSKDP